MLRKADTSATAAVVFALGFFFIGGVLTTVVPPLVDKSWARPFYNTDPAKGPTGELKPYTAAATEGPRRLRSRRLLVLPHPADPHPSGRYQAFRLERR